jgi:hypothetical protein
VSGSSLSAAQARAVAATSTESAIVPACPHISFAVDGTIGPLFCTIDNPVALRYYAAALKPLLALGPNTTPGQVEAVLASEFRVHNGHALTGTYPIQCEVFQLAYHRWRWSFFYAPPDCPRPSNDTILMRGTGASSAVVLGSPKFTGPYGKGWGTAAPTTIFNGGDPSGLVTRIHWSGWGGAAAVGHGLNAIFKPKGGYYAKLANIQLIAYDLGRCTPGGPLAYRGLIVRVPAKPGGRYGSWLYWSGDRSICINGFGG